MLFVFRLGLFLFRRFRIRSFCNFSFSFGFGFGLIFGRRFACGVFRRPYRFFRRFSLQIGLACRFDGFGLDLLRRALLSVPAAGSTDPAR